MKRSLITSIALCSVIALSGCGKDNKNDSAGYSSESSNSTSISNSVTNSNDNALSGSMYTEEQKSNKIDTSGYNSLTAAYNDIISYSVNPEFEMVTDKQGMFKDNSTGIVYALQGNTPLMSYEPEELYADLLGSYSNQYTVLNSDDNLEMVSLEDGTEAYVANMEVLADGLYNIVDLIIMPSKNLTITYVALYNKEIHFEDTCLRDITLSTKINTGTEDLISGNSFTLIDNSEICLEDDGSFIYYQDGSNHDGSYMSGTYEVYRGQDATDKLVSLEEYGLTEEELNQTLKANMCSYTLSEDKNLMQDSAPTYQICKDNFYAVILHNEKMLYEGVEETMDNDVVYLGYYIYEKGFFDMLNCNSANYSLWTQSN